MSGKHFSCVMDTPVARLGILTGTSHINSLHWLSKRYYCRAPTSDYAAMVMGVLTEYFERGGKLPALCLDLRGTDFQLRVWRAMMKIPMGTVISYGELAKSLHTSSRAVGQACRTNPVVLFVPCHRVVSSHGIGGYMGKQNRLNIKKWLLNHEGAVWS